MDAELLKSGETVAAAAVTAWASKDLVTKLLGPTVDYIGGEAQKLAAKCNVNLNNIFTAAARKLGSRIDTPGVVNPRVLKGVLTDGAFTEDALGAEYFGGVLASARSVDGNDRAVPLLAVIRELATTQLRLHYICYATVKTLLHGSDVLLGTRRARDATWVFVSFEELQVALNIDPSQDLLREAHYAVSGLVRTRLLGDDYCIYPFSKGPEYAIRYPRAPRGGIIFQPSVFGIELYLWAHGSGGLMVNEFARPYVQFELLTDPVIPAHAQLVPASVMRERSSGAQKKRAMSSNS